MVVYSLIGFSVCPRVFCGCVSAHSGHAGLAEPGRAGPRGHPANVTLLCRGKGGKGGRHAVTQPLRKHCGSIAASLGAPCRLAAFEHRPTTTRRPTATPAAGAYGASGATAAGSAVRLRIASPRIRFRDAVDPRAPLTLMARHPGGPGRPPLTVMHAVHKIRIIKNV